MCFFVESNASKVRSMMKLLPVVRDSDSDQRADSATTIIFICAFWHIHLLSFILLFLYCCLLMWCVLNVGFPQLLKKGAETIWCLRPPAFFFVSKKASKKFIMVFLLEVFWWVFLGGQEINNFVWQGWWFLLRFLGLLQGGCRHLPCAPFDYY